jgi:hypothetical protein
MPALRLRAVAAAALACAVSGAFAADAAPPLRAAHPMLALPESGAAGERAIELLGANLPAVAAAYGKTPEALRALLAGDRSVRLDATGHLYVVEELDAPIPPSQHPLAQTTPAAPVALDQTFLLHSRPKAQRTVYLNFKGATLQGTAWNGSTPTINAQAYDIDGNPGAFSDAELQRIQGIWQRVAEDYSPFDVDVTTEAPPAARLTRTDANDQEFGTTALVTNHNGVYSCSCGGVAYIGIYDDTSDYYKPALVFFDMLAGGDEKDVAEAISHEVGHNFGLSHDGTSTTGYYGGQGSGPTGWAPIMGVGYYQALVQWSQGEYADANNKEDDIQVIQDHGGPLRKDDHGNTTAKATPLTAQVSGTQVLLSAKGVIERRADKDVFKFSAGAGASSFTLAPDSRSGNLDISVKLQDAAGKVLAKSNPIGALGASIAFTLPAAGTYYLSVSGVGEGDPAVTGYSDYGSLGQYAITGSAKAP